MLYRRYSYFGELRRQALASTAVYNVMIDSCHRSAEINDLLSHMEDDGVEADLDTYVALHRAWYHLPSVHLLSLCVGGVKVDL